MTEFGRAFSRENTCKGKGEAIVLLLIQSNILRGEYVRVHQVKWICNTRITNTNTHTHTHLLCLCSIGNTFILMIQWSLMVQNIISRLSFVQETSCFRHGCVRHVLQPFTPQTMWLRPRKRDLEIEENRLIERQHLPNHQQVWELLDSLWLITL